MVSRPRISPGLTKRERAMKHEMNKMGWKRAVVMGALWLGACGADNESTGLDSSVGSADNAEITNNQEEGVDEGGIVKNIGDHLLVLRQGRLFSVDVAERARQSDSVRVALDEHLNEGVWYDEMLVRDRDVYVIGYRYVGVGDHTMGATEIAHFYLERDGNLSRMEVQFFESVDYYSGSNYASRRIGDRLLFYIPLSSYGDADRQMTALPSRLDYRGDGVFERGAPILAATDIVDFDEDGSDMLHTIVDCDLEGERRCRARAVRGDWSMIRYITRDTVYLWGREGVYAMSLEDGSVGAVESPGAVIDQFSMRERDGVLQAVVSSDRSVKLASVARSAFAPRGDRPGNVSMTPLYTASPYLHANRFVEDAVLLGVRDGEDNKLIVHPLNGEGRDYVLDLGDEVVTRIEPMRGVGALVSSVQWHVESSGWFGWNTRYTSHTMLRSFTQREGVITHADSLELEGLGEGESRSHGFFFRPAESGGMFGLPITGSGDGWWGSGPSNIAFFDVSREGALAQMGAVSASDQAQGACETSCTDWYGNTRPIFLGDRVFALMGSEIVEIEASGGAIRELHRVALTF